MSNKMQSAEVLETFQKMLEAIRMTVKEKQALRTAAEIIRNHDIVRCGECRRYNSTNCPAWNEGTKSTANYMLFCGVGERKDGGEK